MVQHHMDVMEYARIAMVAEASVTRGRGLAGARRPPGSKAHPQPVEHQWHCPTVYNNRHVHAKTGGICETNSMMTLASQKANRHKEALTTSPCCSLHTVCKLETFVLTAKQFLMYGGMGPVQGTPSAPLTVHTHQPSVTVFCGLVLFCFHEQTLRPSAASSVSPNYRDAD